MYKIITDDTGHKKGGIHISICINLNNIFKSSLNFIQIYFKLKK